MFGFKTKIDPEIAHLNGQVNELLRYTPDLEALQQLEKHLVFICDELKLDHPENGRLGYSELKGRAFTESDKFSLWSKKLGKLSHAIPLDNPKPSNYTPAGKIKGELYLVTTETMISLDKYKENGVNFSRRRVPIQNYYKVYHREEGGLELFLVESKEQTIEAWMWVGINEVWDPQISFEQFKRVRRYPGSGRVDFEYYCFTEREYTDY